MAQNRSKAQVAKFYKDLGIMQPTPVKLEGEALQRHLRQASKTFADSRTKRLRTRSAQRRAAIND